MKKRFVKYLLLALCLGIFTDVAVAQKKTTTKRAATKRTTTRKTAKSKTKAKIQPTVAQVDTVAAPLVVVAPPPPNDSLPIPVIKKSLRPDEAVETTMLKDRTQFLVP